MRRRESSLSVRRNAISNRADILQQSHCSIPSVDTDHTTSGMCTRAAKIQARHRRTSGEPSVPHIRRKTLSLKDVPASQPDLLLDIRRTENLHINHRAIEIRAEPPNRT